MKAVDAMQRSLNESAKTCVFVAVVVDKDRSFVLEGGDGFDIRTKSHDPG